MVHGLISLHTGVRILGQCVQTLYISLLEMSSWLTIMLDTHAWISRMAQPTLRFQIAIFFHWESLCMHCSPKDCVRGGFIEHTAVLVATVHVRMVPRTATSRYLVSIWLVSTGRHPLWPKMPHWPLIQEPNGWVLEAPLFGLQEEWSYKFRKLRIQSSRMAPQDTQRHYGADNRIWCLVQFIQGHSQLNNNLQWSPKRAWPNILWHEADPKHRCILAGPSFAQR